MASRGKLLEALLPDVHAATLVFQSTSTASANTYQVKFRTSIASNSK
jgi:hypothetical protein